MKETAVCRQEKANCISSDILADMLDGTDFLFGQAVIRRSMFGKRH